MNEDRASKDESKDPLPDPLTEVDEPDTHDVRIEGRTARATDDLDEKPKRTKNVQEPPD